MKDDNAFIFSLDRLKFLRVKPQQKVLGCYKKQLAYFVDAFCLNDLCDSKLNYLISMNSTYATNKKIDLQDFLLGDTEKCYKVTEIEVFSTMIEAQEEDAS